ncbi:DUF4347 domain-containing protein [Leptothoe kymatousa]|uniref:DUF4347 domain-containing protein n=1 Tax=Leptothoe kymatousa TAU-MAC 1615 TaxID=2364775 RepID=A0ABS5XYC0_9CYAN|nr:DUF4347 domain-containing protein [Leptothoe kymatousa]MBT9310639.1 DUF4347 domain-containing protein [Leptothoe kymatousa TAU-MAC 1615]
MLTSTPIVDVTTQPTSVALPNQTTTQHTVILDSQIEDLNLLLDGLRADVTAHVLTAHEDGLQQITAFLTQHPTQHLTLLAHGFPGGMRLGATTVDINHLDTHTPQLQQWFAPTAPAKLTLMACNVAQGDAGQAFIQQLATVTAADVTASVNVLGNGVWLPAAKALFTPATLAAYRGTLQWSTVGAGAIAPQIDNDFDIEIDSQGTPYIIFQDDANGVTVKRFDGLNWVDVGVPGFPEGNASFVGLEFGLNDTPYVVFKDDANNSRATVMQFNGTDWAYVGDPGFSPGGFKDINMKFYGDAPYVVFTDRTQNSRATVMVFDGLSWETVGNPGFSTGAVAASDINIDGNGVPYVAYVSGEEGFEQVSVQRFINGQWSFVGAEGFSVGAEAARPDIEFDNNNVPYLVYRARGNGEGNKAIVQSFNGTDWIKVGSNDASIAGGFHPDLEFDQNNVLNLAIVDQALKDKVSVRILNPDNTWGYLDDSGFSLGPTNFPDLEFDSNNLPYVLYRETFDANGDVASSAVVKRLGEPATVVDNIAPVLASVSRKTPLGATVPSGTVVFEALFSEAVANVGPEDFVINGLPTATIDAVTTTDSTRYDIAVTATGAAGSVFGLDLATVSDIVDIAGNGLTLAEPTVDEAYTLAGPLVAPVLSSIRRKTPVEAAVTGNSTLVFEATFSEGVVNVGPEDFVINGLPTATIAGVTAVDATRYDIAVTANVGDAASGTVGLDLAAVSDIVNAAGTALTLVEPTVDQAYTVTAPGTVAPAPPATPVVEPPTPPVVLPEVVTPVAPGALTILPSVNRVEVTSLGTDNTLQLTFRGGQVTNVPDILVFDEADALIGQFSLLDSDDLAAGYTSRFTISSNAISVGQSLQFAIQDGETTWFADPARLSDSEALLRFGNGFSFNVGLATETGSTNLLVNDAESIDLTGQASGTISFSVYREAAMDNTVDLYTTDFADGGIVDAFTGRTLMPGDAGYRAAAISNRLNLNLSGTNGQVNTVDAAVTGGMHLGIFVVIDGIDPAVGEVVFSHSGANANGADHIKHLGDNSFGIEDQAGLGDKDFDDIVLQFSVA